VFVAQTIVDTYDSRSTLRCEIVCDVLVVVDDGFRRDYRSRRQVNYDRWS